MGSQPPVPPGAPPKPGQPPPDPGKQPQPAETTTADVAVPDATQDAPEPDDL